MRRTFRALQNRNYRLWVSGTIVSNFGTWMQRTAQDWLVLTVLTNHSGFAVGVTTGLQFAPLMLLSAHAGLIADRYPKRLILFCTQAAMGLTALVLGVLVVSDAIQLWHVFVCALVLGVASSLDNPARQAFVSEVVPRRDLIGAVSLNSASMNIAKLSGPAAAGLLIHAEGTGPAFLVNAVSFGAVILALTRMRVRELFSHEPSVAGRGQVREGLRYVRQRRDLVLIFGVTGFINMATMNFQMTNALMASEAFHQGPEAYGLLGSMLAVGSLGAALAGARRERPKLALVVVSALALGVFTIIAATMPSYWLYALLLLPVGLCSLTFLNVCATSVQLSTAPQMRGRVLALYVTMRQGTTPVGAPVVGWIGGQFGARSSVLVGGIGALCAGLAAMVLMRRDGALQRSFDEALDSEHADDRNNEEATLLEPELAARAQLDGG